MRERRRAGRRRSLLEAAEDDPLSAVANLFDVAMMFAVALLLAVFAASSAHELLAGKDVTIIRNAGAADMEIIRKQGVKLERLRMSDRQTGGTGTRLGYCYRLADGDVVYVPEETAPGR